MKKESERFELFLSEQTIPVEVEFRNEMHRLEHILYKWLRCELVHTGEIPTDIQFIPQEAHFTLTIRGGGKPDCVLQLSENLFELLIHAVATDDINASEFEDFHYTIKHS